MGEILEAYDRRIKDYEFICIEDFYVLSPKEVPPILVLGQPETIIEIAPQAVRDYFESYPNERQFAHVDGQVYRRPLDGDEVKYKDENPNNNRWRQVKNWTPRVRRIVQGDPLLQVYFDAIKSRIGKIVPSTEVLTKRYGDLVGNVVSTNPFLCLALDIPYDNQLERLSRNYTGVIEQEMVSEGCVTFGDPNINDQKHATLDVLCRTDSGFKKLVSIGSISYTGYVKGPVELDD